MGIVKKHIEVTFFDGIYEVTRKCYVLPTNRGRRFRIVDCQDGEEWTVSKGYKDHVTEIFTAEEALSIMEETGNMTVSDHLWIINHGGN